jgi:hypothetical protein
MLACDVCCREEALLLLQRPLSQQLELLHLWHAVMTTYLCSFLQQFKEAGGHVMAAAGGSDRNLCSLVYVYALFGERVLAKLVAINAILHSPSPPFHCPAALHPCWLVAFSTSLTVLLCCHVDKGSFSVAVEQVCYEGPVKLKVRACRTQRRQTASACSSFSHVSACQMNNAVDRGSVHGHQLTAAGVCLLSASALPVSALKYGVGDV